MRTLFIAALVALLSSSWVTAMADGQGFAFKADGSEPIVHFTRLHHRVADVDDHQELSVYADGRVRVHTPSYMKNPGTFEYRLSDKAMQSVLGKLEAKGLMSFDQASAREQRATAAEARRAVDSERFHVSDLTATHITLNFASFGARNAKGTPVRNDIVWNDLPADALRYANVGVIAQLAEAERVLLALTDHSRRNATRITGGR